jgi:hypothetical protein
MVTKKRMIRYDANIKEDEDDAFDVQCAKSSK